MTLAEAFGVIRRLWVIPIICILLGAGGAAAIKTTQTKAYQSRVDMVLTADIKNGDSNDVSNALVALDRRTLIGTLAVVTGSDVIESSSISRADVPSADITSFRGTAVADANVVTLEVTGRTPRSVARVTGEALDLIVARFGHQYPLYRVEPIDRPRAVVDTGTPWWQLLAAGIVSGALLGALVALSVDAAKRSRLDRDPSVPMGYVAVPIEFVQPTPGSANRFEANHLDDLPRSSSGRATVLDLLTAKNGSSAPGGPLDL